MSDLEGRGHREIFLKTIKSLSVVPQNYLTEWEIYRNQSTRPNIPYPHEDEKWICECGIYGRPKVHKRCICKQHIGPFFTLINKLNRKIIWIGCDCAKQYMGINGPENTCLECGQYTRKNKTNLCPKCKKLYVLVEGQYKNMTFHHVYDIDKKYCCFIREHPNLTSRFILFQKWLLDQLKKNPPKSP